MGPSHQPLVTVLIDTYNSAHLLDRAIESALTQTFSSQATEILVVDDGSSDRTVDVVQRYGSRVRYSRKDNGGQASALNEGVRRASGDIICFLDGDDYFYPGKVAAVVDAFTSGPSVGLIYNRYDIVTQDGEVLESQELDSMRVGNLKSRTLLGYSWGCVTSAMSVRRRVVEPIAIPEEPFRVSADFFLATVLPLMTEVGVVPDALSAWVAHGGNSLLHNPMGDSPELNRSHRAAIMDYVENELNERFVTYLGRDGVASGLRMPTGLLDTLGIYLRDAAQISRADVDVATKFRAQAKLIASMTLPTSKYRRVKALAGSRR